MRKVQIGLGRYTVTGSIHVLPEINQASLEGEPYALLQGRDLLVPLTDAKVRYLRAGKPARTSLVNASTTDPTWISGKVSNNLPVGLQEVTLFYQGQQQAQLAKANGGELSLASTGADGAVSAADVKAALRAAGHCVR